MVSNHWQLKRMLKKYMRDLIYRVDVLVLLTSPPRAVNLVRVISSQAYLQDKTSRFFLIAYPFERTDATPRACTSYATAIEIWRTVVNTHTRRCIETGDRT